jgi:hypothetical protein
VNSRGIGPIGRDVRREVLPVRGCRFCRKSKMRDVTGTTTEDTKVTEVHGGAWAGPGIDGPRARDGRSDTATSRRTCRGESQHEDAGARHGRDTRRLREERSCVGSRCHFLPKFENATTTDGCRFCRNLTFRGRQTSGQTCRRASTENYALGQVRMWRGAASPERYAGSAGKCSMGCWNARRSKHVKARHESPWSARTSAARMPWSAHPSKPTRGGNCLGCVTPRTCRETP